MLGSASLKLSPARFRWGWTLKLCSINKWSGLGLSGRKSKAQSCSAPAEYILPLVTCTFTKKKYEKKNEKVIAKYGPTQHRPTQLTICADKDLERYSSGQALPGPLKVGLALVSLGPGRPGAGARTLMSQHVLIHVSNCRMARVNCFEGQVRNPARLQANSSLLPPPKRRKRLKIKT